MNYYCCRFLIPFVLVASIFGCRADTSPPLKIVTTFSILQDFVREIGKDKVVISIVGPNSDAIPISQLPGMCVKLPKLT